MVRGDDRRWSVGGIGPPWEGGSPEAFDGESGGEVLCRDICCALESASALVEVWRRERSPIQLQCPLCHTSAAPGTVPPVEADGSPLRLHLKPREVSQ